jgi:hypothetical protein
MPGLPNWRQHWRPVVVTRLAHVNRPGPCPFDPLSCTKLYGNTIFLVSTLLYRVQCITVIRRITV